MIVVVFYLLSIFFRCGNSDLHLQTSHWRDMRKESIALTTTVVGTSPTSSLELMIVKSKYGITRLECFLINYVLCNPILSGYTVFVTLLLCCNCFLFLVALE